MCESTITKRNYLYINIHLQASEELTYKALELVLHYKFSSYLIFLIHIFWFWVTVFKSTMSLGLSLLEDEYHYKMIYISLCCTHWLQLKETRQYCNH